MFRVVVAFADMQDGGYIYNAGDGFPRAGINVNKKRLEELSSDRNRRGVALIVDEGLSEATEDTKKTDTGVGPSKTPEAKKKARKG